MEANAPFSTTIEMTIHDGIPSGGEKLWEVYKLF